MFEVSMRSERVVAYSVWPFYAQFSQQPLPGCCEQGDRGSSAMIVAPVECLGREEDAMDDSCAEADKGEQDEEYSATVEWSKSDEASPPILVGRRRAGLPNVRGVASDVRPSVMW